ncbi:MAG TPA: zinc ribbon domain-containing protein [Acidobacteriota bacterium]|jgi:putative FmdB family regulatory protein
MPLYEYRCSKCGDTFEVMQKVSDPPVETCRKCGGKTVKLLSSPAIQFKGGGWYVTDYSGKGAPKTDSTDSKSKDPTKDSGTKDKGDSSKKEGDSSKKGDDTPREKASSGVR